MDQNLPPGWEARWDARFGRFYYINHHTKTTSWEKPAPVETEEPIET